MTSGSPLPTDRCLLGIAEELQVQVLLELEAADILTCTKVCRTLADVVKRTQAVQYKLELGLAGMIDGTARGVMVGKKLEQLRAYQKTWSSNDIPLDVTTIKHSSFLALFRPASRFTGITEKAMKLNFQDHLPDPEFQMQGCSVDHTQDLVVITQLLLGEIPQMLILSISQDGAFHPLASQPHYEGDQELSVNIDPEERIEICGDLVAWTIATDSTEIVVLNWKTGATIWSSSEWHDENPNFYLRCYILDSNHLMVVENMNLHIHKIDPNKPSAPNSYFESFVTLQLPALAPKKRPHAMDSEIQRPPVFPGTAPLFERDPVHTLLALRFSACNDPLGFGRVGECKRYLLLIPVATIFAQIERTRSARTLQEGTTASTGRKRPPSPVVPWETWSVLASGTRAFELKHDHGFDMSAQGSLCMLMPYKEHGPHREKDVFLIDARPLAGFVPQAELDLQGAALRVSDCITDPAWFVNPVRSTLPCRIAYKTYVTEDESGGRRWMTGPPQISHDGLLGVRY
ncbi:hypothetical protein C8Q79DRAFT_1003284 [Trametes meyenii]|nr:hypothetical protein C8Q79DRAFT_1003284 [Trametes meyenii]